MMEIIRPLLILFHAQRERLAKAWREQGRDAGLSTLEVAVIAVGLLLVAGLLVSAITAAVKSRTSQIK